MRLIVIMILFSAILLVPLGAATLQLQEGAAAYAGCTDTCVDMGNPVSNYDAYPGLWLYDYESSG